MFQVYEGPEEFVGCVLRHGIVALIAWTLTGTGAGYGLGFRVFHHEIVVLCPALRLRGCQRM